MKYFSVCIVVVIVCTVGYWFFVREEKSAHVGTPINNQATTTDGTKTPPTSSSTATQSPENFKTYENKTWGIRFEYPSGWEITEPAFYSVVSKLNLSINPKEKHKYPETILINITPKEWIDGALKKMNDRGVTTTSVIVAGFPALFFEDEYMGIPSTGYLVLINDTYWIDISGMNGYEDILNQVLESLVITPVKVQTDQ